MIKRIFPVALALILVAIIAFPASADIVSYNINDFIASTDVDGVNDLMTIVIPYENNSFSTYTNDVRTDIAYSTSVYNAPIDADYVPSIMDYQVKDMTVAYLPLGKTGAASYFDIGALPSSTVFSLKNIVLYFTHNGSGLRTHVTQSFSIQYYDVNGDYLGTQWVDREYEFIPEILGIMSYNLDDVSFTLNKPTGAKYVKLRMLIKFNYLTVLENFDYMTVDIGNFLFQMSITDADRQLLQENKELLNEVNKQLEEQNLTLGEIQEGIDNLPGDIQDGMQDIIDKEEAEAEQKGDSSAGAVMDIIPNYQGDFISAFSKLADVMSYNGTECVITSPAIKIPSVGGLFPEFEVLPAQEIDFEEWFNRIPDYVLRLIRALFDCALVIYCAKELYGLIEYALTSAKKMED